MRVKCFAQEHNAVTLASARTRTAQSEVQHAIKPLGHHTSHKHLGVFLFPLDGILVHDELVHHIE